MGFWAMILVNVVGGVILLTGATWLAPILGFTKIGIAAGSWAASAHAWYGCVGAGSIIAALMARTMGP